MNDERASVLERMTSALSGGSDMEVMGALGAAQVSPGRLPAAHARQLAGVVHNGVGGLAIVSAIGKRLTALQAAASQLTYDQAKGALLDLVARLAKARRWALTQRQVERVAESSLLMHLHPICQCCHGRRYELIPGTPHTGQIVCPACAGTGQRPYPQRFRDEIAATLTVLGLIQGLTERAVARELQ